MCHNPYFNRWFSAILSNPTVKSRFIKVTILILIDGFLQYEFKGLSPTSKASHNPYFNRWFSAIEKIDILINYFYASHNPYFNRWFSAIKGSCLFKARKWLSQSLF